MKKLFYAVSLLGCTALYAQLPGMQWQKMLGGTASDSAFGLAQLTDGNYVVAGGAASNNGDVEGNHGSGDIWLVKLSPDGDVIWKKAFGGSWDDRVEFIYPTTDGGVVVTGATYSFDGDIPLPNPPGSNAIVAKFDTNGNTVWAKNIEGLNGQSVIQTSDGGYIMAGERYSPGVNVSYDALIVKLDADGNTEWEETYGGDGLFPDLAWRIKETSDGNYIFGGSTVHGDGSTIAGNGGVDVWIVKINTTGGIIWQKLYGTTAFDDFNDIVEMPDGGFMVACSTPGNDGNKSESFGGYDAWVLRLDAQGEMVWEKSYGTGATDNANALFKTPGGNYMIGGRMDPQTDELIGFWGGDFWVFEINDSGDMLDQETYGGNRSDYLFSFYQTSDYGYLMAGWSYSDNNDVYGNHSDGQNDMWVAKLADPPLKACGEGNSAVFNLTAHSALLQESLPNAVITYYTNADDANAGTNAIAGPEAFTNTTNPQTIYTRTQVSANKWHINQFSLEVVNGVTLTQPENLAQCVAAGANSAVFDLTAQEAVILSGLNAEDYTVAYFPSEQDAQLGTNAFNNPENFTSGGQVIYVGVTNTQTGCTGTTAFGLVLNPAASLPVLPNLTLCSPDNNGTAQFNLTEQELLLGDENFPVWYFTSLEDAVANTNFIPFAGAFENTQNPQTIYIRAGEGNCYAIGSFQVIVADGPSPIIAHLMEGCPPFNLTQAAAPGQGGLQFSYYASEEDAALAQNAIVNAAAYTFTGAEAIVYVRTENAAGCFAVEPVGLAVKGCDIPKGISPNGDEWNNEFDLAFLDVSKLIIYNRYGLEVYSLNNYTTQWHGQDSSGHELPSGTYYYFVQPQEGPAKTGWVYLNRETN